MAQFGRRGKLKPCFFAGSTPAAAILLEVGLMTGYDRFCASRRERLFSDIRWYAAELVKLLPDIICGFAMVAIICAIPIIAALFD